MYAKVTECARAARWSSAARGMHGRNACEGCMRGMVVTERSHLTELVLVTQDPHLHDPHLHVWPRHTQVAPPYLVAHLCVATIFYDDDLVYVLGMRWGWGGSVRLVSLVSLVSLVCISLSRLVSLLCICLHATRVRPRAHARVPTSILPCVPRCRRWHGGVYT